MKKIPENINILFIVLKMRNPLPPKNTANAALRNKIEKLLLFVFI